MICFQRFPVSGKDANGAEREISGTCGENCDAPRAVTPLGVVRGFKDDAEVTRVVTVVDELSWDE